MAIKLAIIDGTGEWSNASYATSMAHSFCRQLAGLGGAHASYYQRGPSALGLEDAYYMNNALEWLRQQAAGDSSARIMLAGYSRGAATVMAAAQRLQEEGTAVDSMFLFDAVSRQVLAYGRDIASNVQFCAHAVRSDDADLVDKYETWAVNSSIFGYQIRVRDPTASNQMRPWFGHVGLTAPRGVNFRSQRFRGSHGALGGVGWKNVPEDVPAQEQVAAWMNAWLRTRGVPVTLSSFPPSS